MRLSTRFGSAESFCRLFRAFSAPPKKRYGGAYRDRTDDLMLAKHALSQLS